VVRGSRLDPDPQRHHRGSQRPPVQSPGSGSHTPTAPAAGVAPASRGGIVATSRQQAPAPLPVRTAPTRPIEYSDEQQAVIECEAQRVVADAFAGCGKTTTAIGYCKARPRRRILYLVLNSANAADARKRFPGNVDCMTTHSLAWNSKGMREHVGVRLDRRWRAMTLMQQFGISSASQAYHAQQTLQAFFASTDSEVTDRHVDALTVERNLSHSHAMQAVTHARLIWKAICDRNHRCSIPDDAYLKIFALSNPALDYESIILDEAQDANPVTAHIIAAQRGARLLCIGDRHQSVYQFRGSVNAMDRFSLGASRFALTQTYRFGPAIANVANTILGELKGETRSIRGMGADGRWDPRRITYLSRTNAQLFALAAQRRGRGMHWVGQTGSDGYKVGRDGPDNYRLNLLADVYHLWAGKAASVQDRSLRQLGSFEDYRRYGEAARDGEARVLCRLAAEFGHDTPALIGDIRSNAIPIEAEADICVATAHKSKGLEWDCVRLCDDFEFLEELEVQLASAPGQPLPAHRTQDVNLLYVASTRARKSLALNAQTAAWLNRAESRKDAVPGDSLPRPRPDPRPRPE
jgi:F-box protein 18 (helicase)